MAVPVSRCPNGHGSEDSKGRTLRAKPEVEKMTSKMREPRQSFDVANRHRPLRRQNILPTFNFLPLQLSTVPQRQLIPPIERSQSLITRTPNFPDQATPWPPLLDRSAPPLSFREKHALTKRFEQTITCKVSRTRPRAPSTAVPTLTHARSRPPWPGKPART